MGNNYLLGKYNAERKHTNSERLSWRYEPQDHIVDPHEREMREVTYQEEITHLRREGRMDEEPRRFLEGQLD